MSKNLLQHPEIAAAVIESFTESLNAINQKKEMKQIVHKVKGAAGALNQKQLYTLCQKIEKDTTNQELIKQLETNLNTLVDEAKAVIEG